MVFFSVSLEYAAHNIVVFESISTLNENVVNNYYQVLLLFVGDFLFIVVLC